MSKTYDTIIVGGGSGGCVVAARLSEDADHRVLLLEAGPDYRAAELPDELRTLFRPVAFPHEWDHDVATAGARRVIYRQARTIGGGSSVNGGVALRAEPADFERWPAGWSWDEMLPYFTHIENDAQFGEAAYHGNSGRIPVTRWASEDWSPVQQGFHSACLELGFNDCADLNAPNTTGVGAIPMNRDGMARISCAIAYLEPARERANLEVRGDAHVRRVVIEGGRAAGVELANGERLAAGTVVVSSGVLQSPTLLWRSGIGPVDRLRSLGIEVAADSPNVGARFTDHYVVNFRNEIDPRFHQHGAAPLQTILKATAEGSDIVGGNDLHFTPFVERNEVGGYELAISVSLQVPLGPSGTVAAASLDPHCPGDVNFPFPGEPENVRRVRWGVRNAARICQRSGLSKDTDGLKRWLEMGDAELDAHMLAVHGAFYHGAGTCGMGDGDDAVCDPNCRVRGVEGLCVIDASAAPHVPRTNTNLMVIALAEHACDRMRQG